MTKKLLPLNYNSANLVNDNDVKIHTHTKRTLQIQCHCVLRVQPFASSLRTVLQSLQMARVVRFPFISSSSECWCTKRCFLEWRRRRTCFWAARWRTPQSAREQCSCSRQGMPVHLGNPDPSSTSLQRDVRWFASKTRWVFGVDSWFRSAVTQRKIP